MTAASADYVALTVASVGRGPGLGGEPLCSTRSGGHEKASRGDSPVHASHAAPAGSVGVDGRLACFSRASLQVRVPGGGRMRARDDRAPGQQLQRARAGETTSRKPLAPSWTLGALSDSDILHLQRMVGNQAVTTLLRAHSGHHVPVDRTEPRDGLPSDLRDGIEALSGVSVSDVRVHYGSAKPAELDALAYTRGAHIHVLPGQEQHLAHEAWHVVQQRQGRVAASLQTRTAKVNNSSALEQEADVMGEKALHTKPRDGGKVPPRAKPVSMPTGADAVIQLKRYMRGVKSVSDLEKDIEYLTRRSQLHKGTVEEELNNWLEGSGWSSASRYSEGLIHYYSPVGLVITISDNPRVLGNFKGDGNTSTLRPHKSEWWQALEAIRVSLNAKQGTAWLGLVEEKLRTKAVANESDAKNLKDALAGVLLKADSEEKAETIEIMQAEATAALGRFYSSPQPSHTAQQKARILPWGLEPAGMDEAEKEILQAKDQTIMVPETTTEIKYTGSVLNAMLADVEGSYYNKARGSYSAVFDASLREDNWLEGRQKLAGQIRDKLIENGVPNPKEFVLENGKLEG